MLCQPDDSRFCLVGKIECDYNFSGLACGYGQTLFRINKAQFGLPPLGGQPTTSEFRLKGGTPNSSRSWHQATMIDHETAILDDFDSRFRQLLTGRFMINPELQPN